MEKVIVKDFSYEFEEEVSRAWEQNNYNLDNIDVYDILDNFIEEQKEKVIIEFQNQYDVELDDEDVEAECIKDHIDVSVASSGGTAWEPYSEDLDFYKTQVEIKFTIKY